jgi:hypothetical protein
VKVTKQCTISSGVSSNFGTLSWTKIGVKAYRATLDYSPIQFTNKFGTTRTRG